MTAVLLALTGAPWEPALVAALPAGSGLDVARRCVDLDDLLVAAASGDAPVALLAATLPRLDREALARLGGYGVVVVGLAADDAEARHLLGLGVARVARVDPADASAAVAGLAHAVGESLAAGPAVPTGGRGYAHADPDPGVPRNDQPCRGYPDEAVDPAPDDRGADTGTVTAGAAPGAVVVVWGPPGAPGRTTVAIALADEAARSGVPTLLVDADTYAASAAALLGVADDLPGVAAACRYAEQGRLTVDSLTGLARPVATGLDLLTGLPRAYRWPDVRPAALEQCLAVARRGYRLVVVDVASSVAVDDEVAVDVLAPRRDAAALTALDSATLCVVVGAAEPLGLLRLVPSLALLAAEWPGLPRMVVANRFRRAALGASPERGLRDLLARHAGVEDVHVVPDDRPALDAAVLAGRTLAECAPRSAARVSLRALAADVVSRLAAA